jgi:hypothetical protein
MSEPTTPTEDKPAMKQMGDKFRQAMAEVENKGKPPVTPPAALEPPKAPEPPPTPTPPAPTPPSPSGAAPAASTDDPLKDASPKARDNFKRLETKLRETESKRAEIESKLAAAEARGAATEKLELELKVAKDKQAEAELFRKRFYLEHDPQFQGHFQKKIDDAIAKAKYTVDSEHAGKVEEVLKLPHGRFRDNALRELKEELGPDAAPLSIIIAELQLAENERDKELASNRVEFNYTKLQEKRQKEAEVEAQKAAEMRVNFWKQLEPEVELELDPVKDDTDLIQTAKRRLKGLVDGTISTEDYAGLLKDAARGIKAAKTEKAKEEKISQLEEQVKQLTSASPGLTGGKKPAEIDETDPRIRWRKAMAEMEQKSR